MNFDPANTVVQLCAEGMEMEGAGNLPKAKELFLQAWALATNDFEKFTAAHYVARQQSSIEDKLAWDQKALNHALQIENEDIKAHLPSLYLNIAKCYEDLKDQENAKANYQLAFLFINFLPADGYGRMIKAGVINGLARLK